MNALRFLCTFVSRFLLSVPIVAALLIGGFGITVVTALSIPWLVWAFVTQRQRSNETWNELMQLAEKYAEVPQPTSSITSKKSECNPPEELTESEISEMDKKLEDLGIIRIDSPEELRRLIEEGTIDPLTLPPGLPPALQQALEPQQGPPGPTTLNSLRDPFAQELSRRTVRKRKQQDEDVDDLPPSE